MFKNLTNILHFSFFFFLIPSLLLIFFIFSLEYVDNLRLKYLYKTQYKVYKNNFKHYMF